MGQSAYGGSRAAYATEAEEQEHPMQPDLRRQVTLHRGFDNYWGENSCFLNVCVQALWHLKPFRDEFLGRGQPPLSSIRDRYGRRMLTVSGATYRILRHYLRGGYAERVISSDDLRVAVTDMVDADLNFGEMADAMEVRSPRCGSRQARGIAYVGCGRLLLNMFALRKPGHVPKRLQLRILFLLLWGHAFFFFLLLSGSRRGCLFSFYFYLFNVYHLPPHPPPPPSAAGAAGAAASNNATGLAQCPAADA